jgi:isoleucyl-tRNA synthetase
MKTVFLPQTDFPIRAQLPTREPALQAHWHAMALHSERVKRGGSKPFVLVDGPPYANGDIHIGHALNKVLKDFTLRTRFLLGYSVTFTPGWDCHGLPIETGVEKVWREEKRSKDADPEGFRDACRTYAKDWMWRQRDQFGRLGVLADWSRPYTTMDYSTEAEIVRTLHELAAKELIYTARRPVLWSAVDQTGLAKNETEEQEHEVDTIWTLFPLKSSHEASERFDGVFLLVWTTTPWSLPGNKALAINTALDYGLYDLDGHPTIMAKFTAEQFPDAVFKEDVDASMLLGCEAVSPLYHEVNVPIYDADYVVSGKGSGIVHVGPASSVEDWQLWVKHNSADSVPEFVGPNGRYVDHWPLFGGMQIVKGKGYGEANERVIEALDGYLVRIDRQNVWLLHSERSKGLLIENATPQWFIDLSSVNFRGEQVSFRPEHSRRRFESMLADRGDWLISRQRTWGTPLALFVNDDGQVLNDPEINEAVVDAIQKGGANAWLENDFGQPEGYHKVTDVLDVWFDSGCVHRFSGNPIHYGENGTGIRSRRQPPRVADLYLEGSDQHRGWFQSSFLISYLTDGHAPYRELLTHGFTLDRTGRKMAKSARNGLDPNKLMNQYGADVVRLWVSSVDYSGDIRVGPESFPAAEETYRKLRNTLRYLLGALNGYSPNESNLKEASILDEYLLCSLSELSTKCRDAAMNYDFTKYMTLLHSFCVHELSNLYFDVRKDRLYCDPLNSPLRLATLETLNTVFDVLVPLLAPVLVHTAEEAWLNRYPEAQSVHLERWPEFQWDERIDRIMELHLGHVDEVRPVIDQAIKAGVVRKAGEVIIRGTVAGYPSLMKELLMVADVLPDPGEIRVENAAQQGYVNCDRCRVHQVELAGEHCSRCEEAMEDFCAG